MQQPEIIQSNPDAEFSANSEHKIWQTVVVRIFIIVITDEGTELLLARRPTWSKLAASRYTLLGGKLNFDKDIGNSLDVQTEVAIRREIAEELRIHDTPPTLWELENCGKFANHRDGILTVFFRTTFDLRNASTKKSDFELAFKTKTRFDDGRFKQDNYDLSFLPLDSVHLHEMAFEYGIEYLRFISQYFPDQLMPLITTNLHQIMFGLENLAEKRAADDMVESTDSKEAKNSALWLRYYSRCEKAMHMLGKLDFNKRVDPLSRFNRLKTSFVYNAKHLLKKSEVLGFQQSEMQSIIDKFFKFIDILNQFLISDTAPRV